MQALLELLGKFFSAFVVPLLPQKFILYLIGLILLTLLAGVGIRKYKHSQNIKTSNPVQVNINK